MKNIFTYGCLILLVSFLGCRQAIRDYNPSYEEVETVLDDWHNAAAEADFDRYFSHFDSDSAIFMGTDATERWTIAEFRPWSKPYFDQGDAWNFTPVERFIYFSPDGSVAWFDESLDTPNLGPARGSGVLIKREEGWKIAHYNLSVPIPNAIMDSVVNQVEEALENEQRTDE